jgi:alpha-beta hydrolase superfamily lysophospholipase
MNAGTMGHRPLIHSGSSNYPIYFPSGDYRLFGWLHGAAGDSGADVGVVICNPFGYEALCAHRAIRVLADEIAWSGLPALRFDYVGTGDSDDLRATADEIELWIGDVVAAANELRRRTGVNKICLLGIRLGALLAASASSRLDFAVDLAAIAPVVSGRKYLSQLRTMKLAASQRMAASLAPKSGPPGVATGADDTLEAGGFVLQSGTVSSLLKLNLNEVPIRPSSQILIVDRADLPTARAWGEAMTANGLAVRYSTRSGLVPMILTEPQLAIVPMDVIHAAVEWLNQSTRRAGLLRRQSAPTLDPAQKSDSVHLVLPGPGGAPEPPLIERPIFLGKKPDFFGIVTEPATGELRRRGVILLNDGATHHIGSNRMGVALARGWARRGYYVLRLDLIGIGDSTLRDETASSAVFPPDAVEDIRTAVEYMRNQYGIGAIALAGLCSGAFHALRSAVCGLAVDRLLMVNPLHFFWEDGLTSEEMELAEVVQSAQRYRHQAFSLKSIKRVLTGKANFQRIFRIIAQRGWLASRGMLGALMPRFRYLGWGGPASADGPKRRRDELIARIRTFDLGRELEAIAERGTRMTFVFSKGESGIDLLEMLAEPALKRLGPACRVRVVEGADHIFSQRAPRAILEEILSEELFSYTATRSE